MSIADYLVDIWVSSNRRKPTVIFMSIERGSSFRELFSADIWGTYYCPKLHPIFHPKFCLLEWNHNPKEVSIYNFWETYYLPTESSPNIPPADCWYSSHPYVGIVPDNWCVTNWWFFRREATPNLPTKVLSIRVESYFKRGFNFWLLGELLSTNRILPRSPTFSLLKKFSSFSL